MTTLADLIGKEAAESLKPFQPCVGYYPAMDWLLVLLEDVSYRSEQLIPGVVDVLWHPHEDRIVGLRIWDVGAHPAGARVIRMAGITP